MSIQETTKNIQLFEKNFIHDITTLGLKNTQENLVEQKNPFDQMGQSNMLIKQLQQNSNLGKEKPLNDYNEVQSKLIRVNENNRLNKSYKFKFKKYSIELLIGYTITIGFMLLNRVIYFPFFEALMIVIIALSMKPAQKVSFFILLSIPMAIANYNLGVWVLTYPQIIICYFSTYIFTQKKLKNLLWIVSTLFYSIFGFFLIAKIGSINKTSKVVLCYIYPFLLLLLETGNAIINYFIQQNTLFLLQISFFVHGISYGMILSLKKSDIQFWYLLVLLTLQIINQRYQFTLKIIMNILKFKQQKINIAQAQSSGYMCINSFHLFILVYMICKIQLNSFRFSYNLIVYVQQWYKPLIVWVFFSTYEAISLIKLRKWENIMIIGDRNNEWKQSIKRGLGLSLGLWFFYLGVCIPSGLPQN